MYSLSELDLIDEWITQFQYGVSVKTIKLHFSMLGLHVMLLILCLSCSVLGVWKGDIKFHLLREYVVVFVFFGLGWYFLRSSLWDWFSPSVRFFSTIKNDVMKAMDLCYRRDLKKKFPLYIIEKEDKRQKASLYSIWKWSV